MIVGIEQDSSDLDHSSRALVLSFHSLLIIPHSSPSPVGVLLPHQMIIYISIYMPIEGHMR